jgi:hypothetical protein
VELKNNKNAKQQAQNLFDLWKAGDHRLEHSLAKKTSWLSKITVTF